MKIVKGKCVAFMPAPDVRNLAIALTHYNKRHPHRALKTCARRATSDARPDHQPQCEVVPGITGENPGAQREAHAFGSMLSTVVVRNKYDFGPIAPPREAAIR
ncbi:hypothetical protein D1Y85_10075 [Paraburkholderia dinghuensis]|uniref:Integrase catalytic domain-containing protein n=1 Tax=Paraburkholderia dinghuensis TaxID=2305225 RepID=A0A3N6Q3T0_9BURK|nr:hypothetical protein D1Y85_10075 [Paraburkholderia dinghuensis]